ncbi:epoxide hydrolase family protein [Streptomyces chromofuscus]|uniref:Epoxide hydrolase n=1 Tax=Streptomyces chromofuscus TaxID=42881 RepID=A0A7M2T5U0_STRCW|nr:epoxide hydrolase family protein [Streptomyces chromofuscus]QOV43519.1 epoxide hydrolase [Streptomyces chromofuscus]GGT10175.1 multidrug MFS transporter [Streptomyces chromofuscus]
MSDQHDRTTPQRFTIDVPQSTLDDLRARLKQTRFAPDLDNEDEYYGISTSYLEPLVEYWADGFDWRKAEQRLNAFTHHRVDMAGTPVHFLREPGKGPAPVPIILSHGWPWTFADWLKVVGPLTDPAAHGGDPADAFDVVVPSLPGFGFSTPLTKGDMNYWKMADIFHALMTDVLGYEKYAAAGADYGALVTSQLGHKYARHLYGLHLGTDLIPGIFQDDRFWDLTGGQRIPDDAPARLREDLLQFDATYASHVAVHMLDAQTLTHGLNDSPVGMLAWLVRRWKKWSDRRGNFEQAFPRDHILTNATIYWVNQAIGSSIRVYRNANRHPWKPEHDRQPQIEAPAGFTFLLGDVYPPGVRTPEERIAAFENGPTRPWFNPVNVNVHHQGGHFGPWENPEAFITDIRETFRKLR